MPQERLQAARDVWWFLLFVVIALTGLSGWNIYRSARDEARVSRTLRVLAVLDGYRASLIDAETSARGFVITGERPYLEPYFASLTTGPQLAAELEQLLAGNVEQLASLQALQDVVQRRFEKLVKLIAVREQPERDILREVALVAEGKTLMDDIRVRLAEMSARERELFDHRGEDAQAALNTSVLTTVIGGVATVAILALASFLMRRDTETRRRAQVELERQVEIRTTELQHVVSDLNKEAAERERAVEELFQTAEELSRSNRELEQFAYVASHDLQEPLRKIQTFGDRLRVAAGEKLDDQCRDYLARMQTSAARMRRLIDDLLTFSRVATRPRAFEQIELNPLVQEVLGDLDDAITRMKGRIDVGPLPDLEGDPVQIRQVFQNLLANALKFHKPAMPPEVVVRGELLPRMPDDPPEKDDRPAVRIEVSDSGIGFDEAYRERIFQVFQRLHGRGEYEGTGIGLAVVRKIVERHGGTIAAHSSPGHGARFVFVLPQQAAATLSRSPSDSSVGME